MDKVFQEVLGHHKLFLPLFSLTLILPLLAVLSLSDSCHTQLQRNWCPSPCPCCQFARTHSRVPAQTLIMLLHALGQWFLLSQLTLNKDV